MGASEIAMNGILLECIFHDISKGGGKRGMSESKHTSHLSHEQVINLTTLPRLE